MRLILKGRRAFMIFLACDVHKIQYSKLDCCEAWISNGEANHWV